MQLIRVQSWPVFSWGEIFFLYTYIIIQNPTNGRVNVTLIEVALKVQDCYDNNLLEYKVSVLYIFSYEAFYKQLLVHEFDNVAVVFCEYLLEKRQLLRKVKEFRVKGTLLTIFSWVWILRQSDRESIILPIIQSSIHFLKTPNLVNKYNARTVQMTISNPMLFMIFYWQKFFYLHNI